MTSRIPPQCSFCVHLLIDPERTCAAFPDGIPDDIWWNRADHRGSYRGDGGVRWEPLTPKTKFPEGVLSQEAPTARTRTRVVNVDPTDIDLATLQAEFERRLDALLDQWGAITADQRAEILDQVRAAVTANDLAALAAMHVSTTAATEALVDAMTDMALNAAQHMVNEAAAQNVRIDPVASDTAAFSAIAVVVTALLGEGLTNAAGREALRGWSPQTSGDEVAAQVRAHLEGLSDTFLRDNLGSAMHSAANTGRVNTMLAAPSAAIYASEVMDGNTCRPCKQINGKWIGNSDEPDITAKIEAVYPNGGYRDCEGGPRCRGTVVSVYRPERVT